MPNITPYLFFDDGCARTFGYHAQVFREKTETVGSVPQNGKALEHRASDEAKLAKRVEENNAN